MTALEFLEQQIQETKQLDYSVYSDFDMDKHKETFSNYLEVILLPTGKVIYAVPSHQEKLIQIGMSKFSMKRDDFIMQCPKDMYADYMRWLCDVTGCIAVWNSSIEGKPNKFQRHKLELLHDNGLYKGEIDWR